MPLTEAAAGALISGAFSAASTGANIAANAVRNKKQFGYWKKQMAIQQQYQEDAEEREQRYLDKQNDYNSVSSQMSRYRAAGLNSNLVTGVQPVASQAVDTSAPSASHMPVGGFMDNTDPVQGYQMYMAAEQLQLQKKLNDAEVRKANADAEAQEIENKYSEQNIKLDIDIKELNKGLIELNKNRQSVENEILTATKAYEIELKKFAASDAENKYQYDSQVRAFDLEQLDNKRKEIANNLLSQSLDIILKRMQIQSESVKTALLRAVEPYVDKVVKFVGGNTEKVTKYVSGDNGSIYVDTANLINAIDSCWQKYQGNVTDFIGTSGSDIYKKIAEYFASQK